MHVPPGDSLTPQNAFYCHNLQAQIRGLQRCAVQSVGAAQAAGEGGDANAKKGEEAIFVLM